MIVPTCKSGRHRSVAVSLVVDAWLNYRGITAVNTHLSDHEWDERTCGGRCDACMHKGQTKEDADRAIDKGVKMINRLIYGDVKERARTRARLSDTRRAAAVEEQAANPEGTTT